MPKRDVIFSPEAADDLGALYDYIAMQSGAARAGSYLARLEKYCLGFELLGERGMRRDDIRPGLRIIGFERRVTIAFHVESTGVIIDRIYYGGRNVVLP